MVKQTPSSGKGKGKVGATGHNFKAEKGNAKVVVNRQPAAAAAANTARRAGTRIPKDKE
jgi:hypothetical protein